MMSVECIHRAVTFVLNLHVSRYVFVVGRSILGIVVKAPRPGNDIALHQDRNNFGSRTNRLPYVQESAFAKVTCHVHAVAEPTSIHTSTRCLGCK